MTTQDASQYKKLSHREHILELPDTYVGSVETHDEWRWVLDSESGKMVHRKVPFNPGFYKLFDELVVNARDARIRSLGKGATPIKTIDISVADVEGKLTITVANDGEGIPIEKHPEHSVWIPELIFGHLLTSGNYNKEEEKIVGGKNGYGAKCLGRNTLVPLWDGTIKKVADIVHEDILIGDDGTPRNILNIMKGRGNMFKVTQAHADPYYVNDEHILTLMMPDHKRIFWNSATNGWSVLWWDSTTSSIRNKKTSSVIPQEVCKECNIPIASDLKRHYSRKHPDVLFPMELRKKPTKVPEMTAEVIQAREEMEAFCQTIDDKNVFDMSIKDYMKLSDTYKLRISGVRGQSVQWEKREVDLDPYILGIWLGDGMQAGYTYACYGEKDPEIISYLEEWGKRNDATITKVDKYVYRITSTESFKKKDCHPLKKLLRRYNLSETVGEATDRRNGGEEMKPKHIPTEYLVNDRETRLNVLAGIIDTDGSVSRDGTRIVISQGLVHKRLAEDIVLLSRSLGFCTQIHIAKTSWKYNGEQKTGFAYRINISGMNIADIPTKLPRKKCVGTVVRQTCKSTGWIAVEDAGTDDFVGIHIDGNERFVVNDFTVTHNCTNIFSDSFTLTVVSPSHGKKYTQCWTDNMSKVGTPSVVASKAKGCVNVTYVPDLSRFPGLVKEEMIAVLKTRAWELAALCGKDVKVSWNGEAIGANTFEKFVKMFMRDAGSMAFETCGPRWEVAAVLARSLYNDEDTGTDESSRAVSFVNGINTRKGGKHVDTVVRNVLGDFCEAATKKKVPVKPGQIRDAVVFFVNATIVNPSFDSQTKETLTTPATKFGSQFKSEKLVDGLMKIGLMEEAQAALEAKSAKDAKKTDGTKKKTLRGFPKLEDALWAGAARSGECTLILTEGDSAATSAISGLNIVGRERFGVFPLRGKLLNVKDISQEKFNKNEELTAIKAIIGLRQGQKYKDKTSLRYGRVMVMADQDHDGSHIKGLLMNLFHTEWPELMKMGFLCSLATPLLKVSRRNEVLSFYSAGEYDRWLLKGGTSGWNVKYYKGLGTSTKQEAREWFERLAEIYYDWDAETDNSLSLAFNKKRSDDRKAWLSAYDPKRILDIGAGGHVPYTRFINEELIHFSNADNLRSLPHIMDGMKPSQRKILYGCFKRGLRSEVKVAQLAGYVSEHAAYHHGEVSLCGTIIGMAQNFVGSNNVNLLVPNGQFGSRLLGGKDSASARYIFTYLEAITDKIFRKEDAGILKHLEDDGMIIEPDYYLPTVPVLLLNGCIGIGTGFSTDIPPYNPADLVRVLKDRLHGHLSSLRMVSLKPWWQGFKGEIVSSGDGSYITSGITKFDDTNNTVTITELPVGVWTKDYKTFLDEIASVPVLKDGEKVPKAMEYAYTDDGKPVLKGFDDLYTDEEVKFILYFDEDTYEDMKAHAGEFDKRFRLTSTWRTSNMVAFDTDMKIVKYSTVGQILEAFYAPRLEAYEKRRLAEMARLEADAMEADAKARFIRAVLEGTLDLRRATDSQIVEAMKKHSLPPLNAPKDVQMVDSYDYLLRLRMDRVKATAVEDAEAAVLAARKAVAELQATTASQLWLKDLVEFEAAWEKMVTLRREASTGSTTRKVYAKKTKAT